MPDFQLLGDNWRAFNCKKDYLLCGPAGTGKTISNLLKIYHFLEEYEHTRVLFLRKTRSSLTETGLVTWERDILGLDNPLLTHRPVMRRVRQDYQFPNKSSLVVAGMDNPEKALSSDWDLIYFLEATDFTLDDYETLTGRLRTGAAPYQQIIMDCNPTTPTHWLHHKISSGQIRSFHSSHKDNPAYFNWRTGQYTELGQRYVETRLRNMTGARRKRFYQGVWAAAEGVVFDGYDPAVHDLPTGWTPPTHWRRLWSIDWGYIAPLVLQFWALDDNHRMYLYREIYMTQIRVETLARMARRLVDDCDEPRPIAVVSDHDPEAQATWREYSTLPIVNAWKEDKYEGIEVAQERFDLQGDGKPMVFFRPDARRHKADDALANSGKPTSTLAEFAGYVWDTKDIDKKSPKELPVKLNDHGCDAYRYAAVYAKRFLGAFEASTGERHDTEHGDIMAREF